MLSNSLCNTFCQRGYAKDLVPQCDHAHAAVRAAHVSYPELRAGVLHEMHRMFPCQQAVRNQFPMMHVAC